MMVPLIPRQVTQICLNCPAPARRTDADVGLERYTQLVEQADVEAPRFIPERILLLLEAVLDELRDAVQQGVAPARLDLCERGRAEHIVFPIPRRRLDKRYDHTPCFLSRLAPVLTASAATSKGTGRLINSLQYLLTERGRGCS